MGHGASSSRYMYSSIFANRETLEGSQLLSESEELRISFVTYIKSGIWVELLVDFFPSATKATHEDRLARERGLIFGYHAPRGEISLSQNSQSKEKFASGTLKRTNTPTARGSSTSTPLAEALNECYVNIQETLPFESSQIPPILFNILLPLYFSSAEHQRFLEFGNEYGAMDPTEFEVNLPAERKVRVSPQTKRAQAVLLACAASFDEDILDEVLQNNSSWVSSVAASFDSCDLAITVQDTSQEGLPIVFANQAFLTLTGHAWRDLSSHGLEALTGEHTEPTQANLLQTALRSSQPIRVAITHYNKKGRAFLNLVAVAHSGNYAIAVHVPASAAKDMKDLEVASDVLLLLTMAVKHPSTKCYLMQPLSTKAGSTRGSTRAGQSERTLTYGACSGERAACVCGDATTRLHAEDKCELASVDSQEALWS